MKIQWILLAALVVLFLTVGLDYRMQYTSAQIAQANVRLENFGRYYRAMVRTYGESRKLRSRFLAQVAKLEKEGLKVDKKAGTAKAAVSIASMPLNRMDSFLQSLLATPIVVERLKIKDNDDNTTCRLDIEVQF